MKESFTFFWRGPLSQWHRSVFVEFDTQREFTHAEQYMMAEKARIFNDFETHKLIMEATHPKTQKALGRKVKNFIVEDWDKESRRAVYRGNLLKFQQNKDLYQALLGTAGTTLVEASPYDKIWGIGLAEGDPRSLSRDTWLGKNWLGEVLTAVRDDMVGDCIGDYLDKLA